MTAVVGDGDGSPLRFGDWLADVTARLRAAGVEDPRRDARLLAAHGLGVSAGSLLTAGDRILSGEDQVVLEGLAARRAGREPVSRILGRRGFWTLDLALGPETLDPRPDTEILVELALDALPPGDGAVRILDLGTGTGCILLALLTERPEAMGVGVDIAPGAVTVARDNARTLGLEDRVAFLEGNWTDGLDGVFDLVVSNPPYIPIGDLDGLEPEVIGFDPRRALDGGRDGLDPYRALARGVPRLLRPGGRLAVEFGQGQAADVARILGTKGFDCLETRRDLGDLERCSLHRKGGS
ncbi:MAG: peptide chain release factor N(5)-glutamine methyltransferase [Rhodospirillum sp.]|nr:peptide chain release factor N(5)-glutamine methyltransferase [Rhodospirillum sp.]MCF8490917.1 peptide chain release factor N(5)-glutamine methyltransferase [Rhodospirillum sp.]MCF8499080.1 peptide chain release factor N(5)-glutamine methyltransferase [Rhodospirillum sp.]